MHRRPSLARHVVAALLLALAPLTACSAPAAADPPPEIPPELRLPPDALVRFHMQQNFDLLRTIERLLLRGRLAESREFARAIAMVTDEPAHGPWASQVVVVRDRAAELARARTVPEALRRASKVAAACAECHREIDGSARFATAPPPPPDLPTLASRMARHRWATDRLWEAVLGDSDIAWLQGLDVLAAAPLDLGVQRAKPARALQENARRARGVKEPFGDRAQAYGEILVTCAACHTAPR